MLAEGLKRHPNRVEALDFLTNLFANELQSPGLEQDLVDALDGQEDRRIRIEFILERYQERDKTTMGRELARAANERFGGYEWPPKTEGPESEGDTAVEDAEDVAESDGEQSVPEPEEPAEPDESGAEESLADAVENAASADDSTEQQRREQLRSVQDMVETQAAVEADDGEAAAEPEEAVQAAQVESPQTAEEVVEEDQIDEQAEAEDDNAPEASREMPVRRPRRLVIAAISVVALIGLAFVGWHFLGGDSTPDRPDLGNIDPNVIDTAKRDAVAAELGVVAADEASERSDARRRLFVEAVFAVDWGESLSGPVEGDDKWSIAYMAIYHAQNEDFERAIADVTRLEQRFADDPVSRLVRGIVDEYRGRYEQALEAYAQGAKAHDDYIPFYTGRIRILTRQGRQSRADTLFDSLTQASAEHPYLHLRELRGPNRALLFDGVRHDEPERPSLAEEGARLPEIVSAAILLDIACGSSDLESTRQSLEEAVSLDAELAAAQLYLGVVRAADLEIESAESAFESALGVDGVSPEIERLSEAAAQRSLAAAGRPDRALRFATPFEFDGVDAKNAAANWVPESVAAPVAPGAKLESELAVESLGVRSLLLADLGMFSTARTQLDAARGMAGTHPYLQLVEVLLDVKEGERRDALRKRRQMKDGPYRKLALAAVSYHDGDYEVAVDAATEAVSEAWPRHLAVRYAVASLAANGQVRRALALHEKWGAGPAVAADADALRMRILARVDPGAEQIERSYDAFVGAEPKGVRRRIDLAGTDFWRKRFDVARRQLEAAARLAPQHPEVNWLMSLVARSDASTDEVGRYLSKSWRSQSGDLELLLELGRIQLDVQRYPQARQLFYRGLLADRTSIEAIAGMGRAYMAYDKPRGRRDLARIVENYGDDSASRAPKAEVLRWLAVLHGVREGSDEGRRYLEQATGLVGDTPPLLVEQARFHEATGDVQAARRSFARALERNSSFASAHLGLARTALEGGDEDVAVSHLKRFLELQVNGRGADWARAKLEELGDPRKTETKE